MNQTIGGCILARAQIEISAEQHEVATGSYGLKLTPPDASLVVSAISRSELDGLGERVSQSLCQARKLTEGLLATLSNVIPVVAIR